MNDQATSPPVPAAKKKDVSMLDFVDGACQFTEAFELAFNDPSYDFMKWRMGDKMMKEEVTELDAAIDARDDVEIVDGACDVAFIALTQAYIAFRRFGCSPIQAQGKVRAAMTEVCHTNLMKNPPERAGEKITKPAGWKKPRIDDLFRHNGGGFMSAEHAQLLVDREVQAAQEAEEVKPV